MVRDRLGQLPRPAAPKTAQLGHIRDEEKDFLDCANDGCQSKSCFPDDREGSAAREQ